MPPSKTKAKAPATTSPLDLVTQVVGTGLSDSFEALKAKLTTTITDNGEQYLSDALAKLQHSAGTLVGWAKKNPVKTAVAVAALLAVSSFLVATAGNGSTAATPAKRKKKPATRKKSA